MEVRAASNSLPGHAKDLPPEPIIFGKSPTMQLAQRKVEKVASTNVPVLIQGESGTGKEVLARLIHAWSPWSSGSFIKVSCAAIPRTLLESELFGYEKGAFTGAYSSKPGRVEMAHRGTLFLDEIAELDPALQAKLLQFLQGGEFCRIGGDEEKRIEARIICATSRQLERAVEAGTFRLDLYFRINVININLPPLCQRREDIPALAEYFLQLFNERFGRNAPPFSQRILWRLRNLPWRGNIRELGNWVARYVILGGEGEVGRDALTGPPNSFSVEVAGDGTIPLKAVTKDARREMERNLILEVLNANHWNRRKTAEVLKISYRALLNKIREAGLAERGPRVPNRAVRNAATSEEPSKELPTPPPRGIPT